MLSFYGVSLPFLFTQGISIIPAINQTNQQSILDLAASAQIFSDTTGDLSITAIQNENFIPFAQFDPSLAVNIYWLKLRIKSELKHPSIWRLRLFESWCEKVTVYNKPIDTQEDWGIQHAGLLCPLKELEQGLRKIQMQLRFLYNLVKK